MKKSNVILQAAIAGALVAMVGTASATTSITNTSVTYATEQFLGSAPNTAVKTGSIAVVAGTSIPANSVVTAVVTLTGGHFVAANASAVLATSTLWASGASFGTTLSGATGADSTAVAPTATAGNANVYQVSFTVAAASTIGLGQTLFTIPATWISANGLATPGALVTATAQVLQGSVVAPVGAAVTGTVVDAANAAQTIATSGYGVTLSAAANTSTAKIDLTATTPSTLFVNVAASATETGSTTIYKLGRVYVKDNGNVGPDGVTAYTAGASASAITATLAASAGFFSGMGTTGLFTIRDGSAFNACAAPTVSATSVVQTLAAVATITSLSTTAGAVKGNTAGSGYPLDVCYTISSSNAQVTGTPTVAVALGTAAATTSVLNLAATNQEALSTNGQTYDVRNYVPAAATGYSTFVRVINTGSLAAAVSGQWLYENGTTSTAATLITSLAAGGTTNLSSSTIEAALGAPTATIGSNRPRLRITAPTNGMQVQTFLASPNGNITDMTGAQ